MIILDTSVLSALLRRRRRGAAEEHLAEVISALLVSAIPVVLPGIVFQEVLSGMADPDQAHRFRKSIEDGFPIALATKRDHVDAAALSSAAAQRGVALSSPDALIAAQTIALGAALFTTDADFARLVPFTRLELFDWR